jgi:hypothetical protein
VRRRRAAGQIGAGGRALEALLPSGDSDRAGPRDRDGDGVLPDPLPALELPVTMPDEITREQVLALFGEAMLAAQQLEEALVGLLGVRRELAVFVRGEFGLTAEDGDEVERVWEGLFRRPVGALLKQLKLAGELGRDVEDAVGARNLLAHHYLRDHVSALDCAATRPAIAGRLRTAVECFRATSAAIEVERVDAMHALGLTEDHVTTPGEARLDRYYDPRVDDYVAPEPFQAR